MLILYPLRTASQRALTGDIPCCSPAASANPVLSAACCPPGRVGVHPAEVREGPRHYPNPLRGARFFKILILDTCLHARPWYLDFPCLAVNHRVALATQACPQSILHSLSHVHLLRELATHARILFPLCPFRGQALDSS